MSLRRVLPIPQSEDFETTDDGLLWLGLVQERLVDLRCITVTWNPAQLAANTHVEETVTATGLKTDDIILAIIKPTFTQGFAVGQGRVSSADTLAVIVVNGTGSASNPGSESYTVLYIKNSGI